nr:hypothetical protein [Methanobrevibacter arboriphilus]
MKAITTVFKSGQGNVTAIPSLMREVADIQRGDKLEWNYDTDTNELTIKPIKVED